MNPRVKIGRNLRRGYCVDIGTEGFSFTQDCNGWYTKRPTKGGVRIGNDCFINSFCSIHEGLERETLIADNCILDCYAHISHDVVLGRSVQVGARATLLGHVVVGDYTKIFAGAVINPRVRIGANCIVGANSYVRHDVTSGSVVYGSPARVVGSVRYPRRYFEPDKVT